MSRLSGPLLDRIDIHVDVPALSFEELTDHRPSGSSSGEIRDTVQIAHSLFQWLRNRFYLQGLVDLGFKDGKVVAMRLNPLGAKGLGIALSSDVGYKQNPLIVNPDFEVILFQDGDSYDLITQIDKFSVRTKSDNTYHFKITSNSVEKAIAEGMTASQILTLLSENSRVEIPQNVIYGSILWAAMFYQQRSTPSGFAGYGDGADLVGEVLGSRKGDIYRLIGLRRPLTA